MLHQTPRILVIDDEPAVGELLRRLFEAAGDYAIETQTDPLAAVQRAEAFLPDLVILDIRMPGMDGVELAKKIRSAPSLRNRPIVFYSVVTNAEMEALHAGAEGPTRFVAKGTPMLDLLKASEEMIARRLEGFRNFRP